MKDFFSLYGHLALAFPKKSHMCPKREPPLLLQNKFKSNKIMLINKFVRNLSLKKVFIEGKVNFKIAYFHFQISWAPPS